MRTSIVAAVVATVFAAWAGFSWWQAEFSPAARHTVARDDALRDGRSAVATLNTLDHRQLDPGFQRWLDVTTGPLHEELSRTDRLRLASAKTVTVGRVVDAALTELDPSAGTAALIAAVDIDVTAPDGATTKRARFQATLSRADSTWKLATLTQVPITPS